MRENTNPVRRFLSALSFAAILFATSLAGAQIHPRLFSQPPASTQPGHHAVAAQVGDIDAALLSSAPDGL
ncbi:MAG TPA: hypothetical protein VNT76_24585, partial [Candidatus Binatus sp.]|nr:hypothetical protein [Candidatus Binatus sp.]